MKNQINAYCTNCGDPLGRWGYIEESLPKPDWAWRYHLAGLPDNAFRRGSFPNNRQCSRFGNCKDTPGVTLVIVPDTKEEA